MRLRQAAASRRCGILSPSLGLPPFPSPHACLHTGMKGRVCFSVKLNDWQQTLQV